MEGVRYNENTHLFYLPLRNIYKRLLYLKHTDRPVPQAPEALTGTRKWPPGASCRGLQVALDVQRGPDSPRPEEAGRRLDGWSAGAKHAPAGVLPSPGGRAVVHRPVHRPFPRRLRRLHLDGVLWVSLPHGDVTVRNSCQLHSTRHIHWQVSLPLQWHSDLNAKSWPSGPGAPLGNAKSQNLASQVAGMPNRGISRGRPRPRNPDFGISRDFIRIVLRFQVTPVEKHTNLKGLH